MLRQTYTITKEIIPKMSIQIIQIANPQDLQVAWDIRKDVFVVEQGCPEDIEWEFEEESTHFLALLDGKPVGTARYRTTEKGIKLERFAVVKNFRYKGVAAALIMRILVEIGSKPERVYLHAQLSAAGLYLKFGFKPSGPNFWEGGIEHVKMIWEEG